MVLQIYRHEQPAFFDQEKVVMSRVKKRFVENHNAKSTEFTGGILRDGERLFHFEAPIHDTQIPHSGKEMTESIAALHHYCSSTPEIHQYGRGYFEAEVILPTFQIKNNPGKEFDGTAFPLKILKRPYAANYPLIALLQSAPEAVNDVIKDPNNPLHDVRVRSREDLVSMKRRSFKECEIHITFCLQDLLESAQNASLVEGLEDSGFYLTTIMNWDKDFNPTEEVCVATLAGPKKVIYPVYEILRSYLAEVGGAPYELDLEFAKTAMIIGSYDRNQQNNGLGEMNGIAFPPMARLIIDQRSDDDERWKWGSSKWIDCKNRFQSAISKARELMRQGEASVYHIHLDGLNQEVIAGERLDFQSRLFDEFVRFSEANNIALSEDDFYVDRLIKGMLEAKNCC
jgi:hypothetical protein